MLRTALGPAIAGRGVVQLSIYVDMFLAAFPTAMEDFGLPEGFEAFVINGNTYARAVAAYERELFTADAPFDDFARGVDDASACGKILIDQGADTKPMFRRDRVKVTDTESVKFAQDGLLYGAINFVDHEQNRFVDLAKHAGDFFIRRVESFPAIHDKKNHIRLFDRQL